MARLKTPDSRGTTRNRGNVLAKAKAPRVNKGYPDGAGQKPMNMRSVPKSTETGGRNKGASLPKRTPASTRGRGVMGSGKLNYTGPGRSTHGSGVDIFKAIGQGADAISRAGRNVASGMRPLAQNRSVKASDLRNAIGETNPIDKLFKSVGERLANPRSKR